MAIAAPTAEDVPIADINKEQKYHRAMVPISASDPSDRQVRIIPLSGCGVELLNSSRRVWIVNLVYPSDITTARVSQIDRRTV